MNKFAIVDFKTDSLKASRSRIIQIAIYLFDTNKITAKWETYINPEHPLNLATSEYTGITNETLADKPKFFEVAKTIVEQTENRILVAHNVRVAYTILRQEFKRLGFTYTRKTLCTKYLVNQNFSEYSNLHVGDISKKLEPNSTETSHGLFTPAICTILKHCLLLNKNNNQSLNLNDVLRNSLLPTNVNADQIRTLPKACGVYYFLNKQQKVVYVGKSQNIQRRVIEHFSQKDIKAIRLHQSVHDIKYQLTGSETIALLLESHEIKRLMPRINRALRRKKFPFVIYLKKISSGALTLDVGRTTRMKIKPENVIAQYSKYVYAKNTLKRIQEEQHICAKYLNLEAGSLKEPCFEYHIKKCKGLCCGKWSIDQHNEQIKNVVKQIQTNFDNDFFILDQGRNKQEQSVIHVQNGQFKGFGYRPMPKRKVKKPNIKKLTKIITPYPSNPDSSKIIRRMIKKDKNLQIVNVENKTTINTTP